MNKLTGLPWWSSMGFGKPGAPLPDDDYADMGTAFGLDASMEPPRDARAEADGQGEPAPARDRLNGRSVI